jgi:hypothetical protein
VTNPIEKAVALAIADAIHKDADYGMQGEDAWNRDEQSRQYFITLAKAAIAALEAMRDQKARDDAIWNEAVKAAVNECEKQRWNVGMLMSSPPQSDAAHQASVAIEAITRPSEFVVVLREPTEKMIMAGIDVATKYNEPEARELAVHTYCAMIKAME